MGCQQNGTSLDDRRLVLTTGVSIAETRPRGRLDRSNQAKQDMHSQFRICRGLVTATVLLTFLLHAGRTPGASTDVSENRGPRLQQRRLPSQSG